jgi:hypothetical protein
VAPGGVFDAAERAAAAAAAVSRGGHGCCPFPFTPVSAPFNQWARRPGADRHASPSAAPPAPPLQLGRRPLLLAGVGGMVASLLALGTAQAGGGAAGAAAWVSVGALLLYVGCYQVSFGPISWLMWVLLWGGGGMG